MSGQPSDRSGPQTVLCLHAHPDDEAMLTGELLAKADASGLRTVVVYGTRGEAGETEHDLGDETLGQRRAREALAACEQLGVDRVEFLDHVDSGMAGTDTNADPAAFSNADPAEVAETLAGLLADEELLAVVGYDANGTYGHPDHVQVHHVAAALADRLGVPWLLDATYNREDLATLADSDGTLDPGFAAAEADLTHFVQGEDWFKAKMEAVKCHGSQAPRTEASKRRRRRGIDGWRRRFGTEWFIARSPIGSTDLGSLTEVLEPKATWPGPLVREGSPPG
ncbi:MAG: PIG-L family deacetylase [Actinomycetota bacterium]